MHVYLDGFFLGRISNDNSNGSESGGGSEAYIVAGGRKDWFLSYVYTIRR